MEIAAFQTYRTELMEELRQVLSDSRLPLYGMMRYHLGWTDEKGQPPLGGGGQPQQDGGKLLRANLCLCVCQAVGGDWHQALPAAAAVELVHNFSLIHDDIEDESASRRRRPAVWQVWGPAQAINAGDAMHALARLALLRMQGRGVPASKVLQAIQIVDEASLRLCEGQYRDLDYEERFDVSLGEYLDMASAKTSALFQAACRLGALVGSDDKDRVDALRSFGGKMGLAYQVRDDILGIWGETEVTGKPWGSDIRQRKKSLPVVYALVRAQGQQRDRLLEVWRQEAISDESIATVMDILDSLGAREYCQKLAEQYEEQAISDLEQAGLPPESRRALSAVADFLVKRQY